MRAESFAAHHPAPPARRRFNPSSFLRSFLWILCPGPSPEAAASRSSESPGYYDYGLFPVLARALTAAGLTCHRFNFSHSGMTRDTATFARPDLFEQDTWGRQQDDLAAVLDHLGAGAEPTVLFGHSRGGLSSLLAAPRHAHTGVSHRLPAAQGKSCLSGGPGWTRSRLTPRPATRSWP